MKESISKILPKYPGKITFFEPAEIGLEIVLTNLFYGKLYFQRLWYSGVILILVAGAISSNPSIANANECKRDNEGYSSKNEEWARKNISSGKIADFSNCQENKIRLKFLHDILLDHSNGKKIPIQGIRIVGARFFDDHETCNVQCSFVLDDVSLDRPLSLEKSVFEGKVFMKRLKTTSFISFDNSTFKDKLNMDKISVTGNLSMNKAVFNNYVWLWKANIGGQLSMENATFTKPESVLKLRYANIGSNLFMPKSKFKDVDLNFSKIDGWFSGIDSTFDGKLEMNSTSVAGNVFLQKSAIYKPANMPYLRVEGNLDLRGAELAGINLSGARVERALRFGQYNENNINWIKSLEESENGNKDEKNPSLTLLNTNVGSLQDTKESWPKNLKRNLKGFTYDHLGASGNDAPIERKSSWYTEWLNPDSGPNSKEPFSPQPYTQLARVFRADGLTTMSDDILFEMRKREHVTLWKSCIKDQAFSLENCNDKFRLASLTISRYIYGFGYGQHSINALGGLSVVLIFLGLLATFLETLISRPKVPMFASFLDRVVYSLDMMLPIIHLREQNYNDVELVTIVRFYFDFHKVAGYTIVFFLLAWLTSHAV